MQLQIEKLENLQILNFYVKFDLAKPAVLLKPGNAENPEFINNIFANCGGEHCLLTSNLLAFKYSKGTDVETARLIIMAELEDFFDDTQNLRTLQGNKNVSDLVQAVADSFIRPTLNRDKGDMEILSLDNLGTLKLKFTGHCAGCPFAQNTLNNVIIKVLQRYIPQIKEVRLET